MATFESESDCFSVYVFSSSNKLEMMREVKSNLQVDNSACIALAPILYDNTTRRVRHLCTLFHVLWDPLPLPPQPTRRGAPSRREREGETRATSLSVSGDARTRPPLPPSPPLSRNFCGLPSVAAKVGSGEERAPSRRSNLGGKREGIRGGRSP